MHVPWNWIKQRPQFLAEELTQYFSVTVSYQRPFTLSDHIKYDLTNKNLSFFKYFAIPFKSRLKLLFLLNLFFVKTQFVLFRLINQKTIIWVTHPEMYQFLPHCNLRNDIIYDCMDDVLEFSSAKNNVSFREKLILLEKKLCIESKIIFCSSNYLKSKLIERYNINSHKIKIINNGINLQNLTIKKELPEVVLSFFQNINKKIVYIGTISEWFDFNLILKSLEEIPDIEYLLFGLTEIQIPQHERITYCGTIEHGYVSSVMDMADILVMPFKVNELIKSVNPVKAYEYVYASKPALIVEYDETKKFADYLFLYKSENDYIFQLKEILFHKIVKDVSNDKRELFISSSQWANRAKEIYDAIS